MERRSKLRLARPRRRAGQFCKARWPGLRQPRASAPPSARSRGGTSDEEMERMRGLGPRGLGSEKPTAAPVGREAVEIRWAGILAGGDGTRLRAFTRQLAGDDRPKQFCRILD